MKIKGRPVWLEINLENIYQNLVEIRKIAKGKKIISVVKDDAYGHSAKKVIKKIDSLSDFYGVACLKEALDIKDITSKPIIVFGGIFHVNEIPYFNKRIMPVVYDFDGLNMIKKSAMNFDINIEIDTGMTRTGFLPEEVDELITKLKENPQIRVQGLMSHFSSADSDCKYTERQKKIFQSVVEKFISNNIKPDIIHIANSAGIFYEDNDLTNAVRPGIFLYGGYPNNKFKEKIKVTPAMTFKTRIISLKKISAGTSISYGRTYITERDSLIAILPVGYGDGYLRALSNKGIVYIKNKGVAKICGRVCMDMAMVDVTDIKDVKIGDEVILWGGDRDEVHPDNIAKLAGTISYELFCIVAKRVKRIFI